MRILNSVALALTLVSAGCTTDDYTRVEGMTLRAGNAQAANTVMQMVDPWQPGVQDTELRVPAERKASSTTAAGAGAGSSGAGATGTGDY